MGHGPFDVAIVGGGVVGLTAGIAMAQRGWRVALVAKAGARRDGRTVALMDGSLRYLESLGLWAKVDRHSAPLATLSIIDDTGSLFRARPVSFHASELKLDAFGRNVENAVLAEAVASAAAATEGLTLFDTMVQGLHSGEAGVRLALADQGEITASLLVGADGRDSPVREFAGIPARTWTYRQSALTAIFAHDRPHHETSTEFHTRFGPFTLVPLPGRRSSLVWLTRPEQAERLARLPDEAFALAVERQAKSLLGTMRLDGPRGLVPMSGLSVERFTAPRTALVGEAAHVFPPIGAQGLNLGLRDVAALASCLGSTQGDPGAPERLARYEEARGADVRVRTLAVDALNRSLLLGFAPVDALRGLGLMALSSLGPLRRAVMRQGLGWAA